MQKKYAKRCHYIDFKKANMQLYAKKICKNMLNMQQKNAKICKKYAEYAYKSKYLHILHIYAHPTLLMLLLVRRARKQKIFASSSEGWGTSARCNAKI